MYSTHLQMIRAVVTSFGKLAALRTVSRLSNQKYHTTSPAGHEAPPLAASERFCWLGGLMVRVTGERGGQSFGLLQDKHTCRIFAMAIIARP